jgi:transcriptional regulator GlxA family with amidase domain
VKATGIKPSEYIQRLRIQKVCDQLESTPHTFDLIANNVGYKDTGACRRAFVNIMGLTPQEFKGRFTHNNNHWLDKTG